MLASLIWQCCIVKHKWRLAWHEGSCRSPSDLISGHSVNIDLSLKGSDFFSWNVSNVDLPNLQLKHIREVHPPQEPPAIEEFKMHRDSLFIKIFFFKYFSIFLGNHQNHWRNQYDKLVKCLFQSFQISHKFHLLSLHQHLDINSFAFLMQVKQCKKILILYYFHTEVSVDFVTG